MLTNQQQIKDLIGKAGIPMPPSHVSQHLKIPKAEAAIEMLEMSRNGELVRTNNGLYSLPGEKVMQARSERTIVPRTCARTQRFPLVENKQAKLRALEGLRRILSEDYAAVLKAIGEDLKRLDRYARGGK